MLVTSFLLWLSVFLWGLKIFYMYFLSIFNYLAIICDFGIQYAESVYSMEDSGKFDKVERAVWNGRRLILWYLNTNRLFFKPRACFRGD